MSCAPGFDIKNPICTLRDAMIGLSVASKRVPGANRTGQGEYMQEYLLSIFPLQEPGLYARLTCICIQNDETDPVRSTITTKAGLVDLLAQTSFSAETVGILRDLDAGTAVQISINSKDQRICDRLATQNEGLHNVRSPDAVLAASSAYLN